MGEKICSFPSVPSRSPAAAIVSLATWWLRRSWAHSPQCLRCFTSAESQVPGRHAFGLAHVKAQGYRTMCDTFMHGALHVGIYSQLKAEPIGVRQGSGCGQMSKVRNNYAI